MWIKTRSQSQNRMSLFWRRPVIWSEISQSILMWLWVLQEKLMVDIGLICSLLQEDQRSMFFNSHFLFCSSSWHCKTCLKRCWRYTVQIYQINYFCCYIHTVHLYVYLYKTRQKLVTWIRIYIFSTIVIWAELIIRFSSWSSIVINEVWIDLTFPSTE